MEGRVGESLGAVVEVRLPELRGDRPTIVFRGVGECAGLEVVNERGELVADGPT